MDRRAFVASGLSLCLSSVVAGCLGGDGDDDEDEPVPEDYREIQVDSESLRRRADGLIVEGEEVFVTLRLEHIGTRPEYTEISLQMRDTDGDALGSAYTRRYGPIEPGETESIRFDVEQRPQDVGGYKLVVTDAETPDES